MQRRLLAAFLLVPLLFGAPDVLANSTGYLFPAGGTCSAILGNVCDGVQVTWIEPNPTFINNNGASTLNQADIWPGVDMDSSDGVNDLGIQAGTDVQVTSGNVQTHVIWHAFAPPGTRVNHTLTTLSFNPGDPLTVQIICTTNCSSTVLSHSWLITWSNGRNGTSQSVTVGPQPSLLRNVWTNIEPQAVAGFDEPIALTPPIQFSNFKYHDAGGWHNVPAQGASPGSVISAGFKSIGVNKTVIYSSGPQIGATGDFSVCYFYHATSGTTRQPCPSSTYSGTAGVGP